MDDTQIMELNLLTYNYVGRVKSIRRSIRRGKINPLGFPNQRRPFNNKANTSKRKGVHSRRMTQYKKRLYGNLLERQKS